MALGTAVHTLVLEPATFNDEFIVMPKIDKRTKIGKELFAEFEAASAGKTVIAEDMLAKAQAMADSVRSHPVAGLLLEDVVSESSIYWWYKTMDPDDSTKFKTMLKVRPDAICRNYPVIIDLKSTVDGSYSGFIRAIQNYYYHVSAAMYLEGVNQCKELLAEMGHFAYTKFLFVCVESAEPYLTSIYELSPEYLDVGKLLYRRCLHTLKHGQETTGPGSRMKSVLSSHPAGHLAALSFNPSNERKEIDMTNAIAELKQAEIAPIADSTMSDIMLNTELLKGIQDLAKHMSQATVTVPKHWPDPRRLLRGDPAGRAVEDEPFAVAQKTHVINGTLGYEAQLVNAVIQASGAVASRFHYEYQGEGAKLACRVGAIIRGERHHLERVAVLRRRHHQNSPLWKTNPKQQLGYLQVKNWARLYCPGAILGVYAGRTRREGTW